MPSPNKPKGPSKKEAAAAAHAAATAKKAAAKAGVAAAANAAKNTRNAETRRANAEMRMKKERKNTAKALKMLQSRGPSIGNIRQNKRAAATAENYKNLHKGGTRRRTRRN